MKIKHKTIRRIVSTTLSRIGYHVGCYPQIYVAVTFITSLVLATGLLHVPLQNNLEHLFISSNARSRIDRAAIESIFPTNASQCDFRRMTRLEAIATIIATPINGTSVLQESIIEDIIKLDEIIQNLTIFWNNAFVGYKDLCCKTERNICQENLALSLRGKTNDIKKGTYNIKYPADITRNQVIVSASEFGGVTLNEENMIRDANAIRLIYATDRSTKEKKEMALKWEQMCLETLSKINLNSTKISKILSRSSDDEISRVGEGALSLILIIGPIMLLFSAVSCLSTDSLISKPWLGIAGCASPVIATVAAFGFLCYCKVDYAAINVMVFFLILGVGVDDGFILIAAWRRTDVNASVPHRMKEAYAEAAVSITITSLTNLLAYCMGFVTPYKMIHIFSAYAALSIVFDYIYQLLFFGGLMALDGYREKYKLHAIFCWPIKRNHSIEQKTEVKSQEKNEKNLFMVFFGEILGQVLGNSISKVTVISMFVIYLSGAIYCMRFVQEGEDITKFPAYTSYVRDYLNVENKYFSNYSHQVQIIINQPLDYSNVTVQNDIEDLLKSFESAPFISDSSITESWLREFLAFTKSPVAEFSLSGYNLTDSEDFISAFKNVFLKVKVVNRFRNDVIFNEKSDKITASRFIVSSLDGESRTDEKFFFENVRKIADKSKIPVIAYNFRFIYYELYINVLSNCLKAISSAAAIVIAVFLLFTPNILFLLSVAVTVVSIQVGLIGYMSLWNVTVNTTALISLVMCTGFCVDYTVHTAYAFINCKTKTPNEKIKSCLYAAGYPVLQGCISTLLSVSVLYFGPSEQFVVFSKIITLMVIFAFFHSIILLPVILCLIDSLSCNFLKMKRRKIEYNENCMNEIECLNSKNTSRINQN
ncbi:patched domain-containing protein 3-like isoform X2 [Centruroides sculpturatus]|uniref:patched domain-containing protein 3-like isoform X2 n=1 Tax=Centruroides sculpturatus TaxID=218467 RepID=UPI000C6D6DF2|nr:patched domain-containing protein 3-like isoform X2 [Centruroides sculpturatus]